MVKNQFKAKIIISLLIIVLILFGIYLSYSQDNASKETSECDKLLPEEGKWECYADKGRMEENVEICLSIPENYSSIADWRNYCIETVAFYKNDVSLCELISYDFRKNNCYFMLATSFYPYNQTICDKISRETIKERCYNVTSGEPDLFITSE